MGANTVNLDNIPKIRECASAISEIPGMLRRGTENFITVANESNATILMNSAKNLEEVTPGMIKAAEELLEVLSKWEKQVEKLGSVTGNL